MTGHPHKIIGIGVGSDAARILSGIKSAGLKAQVTFYCRNSDNIESEGYTIVRSPDPCIQIVADLASGRIDAAVRGTLPANATLRALKSAMGVDHLERVALLETADGVKFLLAPVGIDEGWTVDQKVHLVNRIKEVAKRFGLPDQAGILSGGRIGDIGRHPRVDQSIKDADLVARLTGSRHYEILIEEAIRECGIIIAPDGISGNLIFRTLVFLGSGKGHGAPVLNIDKIFVDTSRASPAYANALRLAESLLK